MHVVRVGRIFGRHEHGEIELARERVVRRVSVILNNLTFS